MLPILNEKVTHVNYRKHHELEQLVEHAETYKEAMAKSEEITSPDDFYNLLVTSISKK